MLDTILPCLTQQVKIVLAVLNIVLEVCMVLSFIQNLNIHKIFLKLDAKEKEPPDYIVLH